MIQLNLQLQVLAGNLAVILVPKLGIILMQQFSPSVWLIESRAQGEGNQVHHPRLGIHPERLQPQRKLSNEIFIQIFMLQFMIPNVYCMGFSIYPFLTEF